MKFPGVDFGYCYDVNEVTCTQEEACASCDTNYLFCEVCNDGWNLISLPDEDFGFCAEVDFGWV
jgi:hypothetical protein